MPRPFARRSPGSDLPRGVQYWLLKSEPDAFSWPDQLARGEAGEIWSGVRNYTARNNMRLMALGDRAFFYHSNEGLAIVGIVAVIALSAQDPTTDDARWDCVTVKAVADMPVPVTLKAIKANPKLAEMSLVKSFRLSVQPVTAAEWKEVCKMGGLKV
jgi:predicted RNA-binding protein with PUA-like domain